MEEEEGVFFFMLKSDFEEDEKIWKDMFDLVILFLLVVGGIILLQVFVL